ncbi:MAG: DUF3445 domain-containing protein [Betaproteobacteria bacterium]|nr:DUF3445 domain-containing protein [Betaproteobacteria bacterium]
MQPGLRRLERGAKHLTPNTAGSKHLREKLAVLSRHAARALVKAHDFDPAAALNALALQAQAEHPDLIAWDGECLTHRVWNVSAHQGRLHHGLHRPFELADDVSRCLQQLPAEWRMAGLLSLSFVEDFAIVRASDATVPWMAVALPSSWAPEDKVGRHFSQIHAPVADAERLRASGASLMQLVCNGQAWERFVWTVSPHPRLHAHPQHLDPRGWNLPPDHGPVIPHRAWWRTERQTFIPVSSHGLSVFTIGVHIQALDAAIATPAQAQQLHDAIASMSTAVLDYRGLTPVQPALLQWLKNRLEVCSQDAAPQGPP